MLFPLKPGAMQQLIKDEFEDMSASTFKFRPLKHYFEPRGGQDDRGYVPKTIATSTGGRETMFDVDLVVPSRWGGIDHPRATTS